MGTVEIVGKYLKPIPPCYPVPQFHPHVIGPACLRTKCTKFSTAKLQKPVTGTQGTAIPLGTQVPVALAS